MDKDAAIDETAQAVKSAGSVVGDEIGKFVKSMIGQATGNSTTDPSDAQSSSGEGYEKLKKDDDEFKKKAEAEWFQKYNAIYANSAAKVRQEKERLAKEHEKEQEEQEKLEKLNETRVRQNFVNRAIEQTRPENKNYGSE